MSTRVPESFDPYHRWLGIPPRFQPPHYYRLLGLDAFEDDADVIESAADRQMKHVREFQSGPNKKLSQRILNELATAKISLLNREKKSAYDAELRLQLAAESKITQPDADQPVENDQAAVARPLEPARQPVVRQPQPFTHRQAAIPAVNARPKPVANIHPGARYYQHAGASKRSPWTQPVFLIIAAGALSLILLIAGITFLIFVTRQDDVASGPEKVENSQPDDRSASPREQPAPATSTDVKQRERQPPASEKLDNNSVKANDQATTNDDANSEVFNVEDYLEVDGMQPVPFAGTDKLPGQPSQAWRYDLTTKPKGADIKNGVLKFVVKRDCVVYLVTSTDYQGNRSGGWWEERVTKDQLVSQGWENLGPCPWKTSETMLRRTISAGEQYRIRTNKYGPPQLIIPEQSLGENAAHATSADDSASQTGQHFLRLGSDGGIELADTKGLVRLDTSSTIEFWARLNPDATALTLVGDRVLGGQFKEFEGQHGGFMVNCNKRNESTHIMGLLFTSGTIRPFELRADQWQHFAVSCDGKQLRVFVDGKLAVARDAEPEDWKPGPLNLHIGFHRYLFFSIRNGFNGDLRAFRVSSSCRYLDTFTPPDDFAKDAQTTVLLNFSNPKGDRIEDLSGNAHDGTITGGEWVATESSE